MKLITHGCTTATVRVIHPRFERESAWQLPLCVQTLPHGADFSAQTSGHLGPAPDASLEALEPAPPRSIQGFGRGTHERMVRTPFGGRRLPHRRPLLVGAVPAARRGKASSSHCRASSVAGWALPHHPAPHGPHPVCLLHRFLVRAAPGEQPGQSAPRPHRDQAVLGQPAFLDRRQFPADGEGPSARPSASSTSAGTYRVTPVKPSSVPRCSLMSVRTTRGRTSASTDRPAFVCRIRARSCRSRRPGRHREGPTRPAGRRHQGPVQPFPVLFGKAGAAGCEMCPVRGAAIAGDETDVGP